MAQLRSIVFVALFICMFNTIRCASFITQLFNRVGQSSFGYNYKSSRHRSATECCVRCSQDDLCVSVNFSPLTQTCDLNSKSPVDTKSFTTAVQNPDKDLYYMEVEPCVSPWIQFDRHCYYVESTKRSFAQSSSFCQDFGAETTDIMYDHENAFVWQIAAAADLLSPGYAVWIGLGSYHTVTPPTWKNGMAVVYTNFSVDEPNNSGGIEDCIEMGHEGSWNDKPCTEKWPVVCKKQLY